MSLFLCRVKRKKSKVRTKHVMHTQGIFQYSSSCCCLRTDWLFMSSILPLLFFASKRGVDVVIVIIITIIIIFFGKAMLSKMEGRRWNEGMNRSLSLRLINRESGKKRRQTRCTNLKCKERSREEEQGRRTGKKSGEEAVEKSKNHKMSSAWNRETRIEVPFEVRERRG